MTPHACLPDGPAHEAPLDHLPSSGLPPGPSAGRAGAGFFPLKTIVAVCDLSPAGENSAWRAALLAREHAAGLRLLCLPGRRSEVAAAQARLETVVAEVQRRLQLTVRAELASGTVRRELPEAAADADLVVVRAAGARPFVEWLAGTHPARLLRHVTRPMLVVRKPASAGYRRVLAAAAFDGDAPAVIAAATAVIRGPHRQVLDTLANHPDLARPIPGDREGLLAARRVRAAVQDVMLREGHARHVREAPLVVLEHLPKPLLRKGRAAFAELLVLARRAGDERTRWLARSDVHQVLMRSTCDVLLLPPQEGGQR